MNAFVMFEQFVGLPSSLLRRSTFNPWLRRSDDGIKRLFRRRLPVGENKLACSSLLHGLALARKAGAYPSGASQAPNTPP